MVGSDRQIIERRQKLVRLHNLNLANDVSIEGLAKEYGVAKQTLYNDWSCRKDWLAESLGVEDSSALVLNVCARWDGFLGLCLEWAQKFVDDGSKSQANVALKNYREGLAQYGEFLQSVGRMPRQAQELHVDSKSASLEVKVNESDLGVLDRARKIVNGQVSGKEQPESLH